MPMNVYEDEEVGMDTEPLSSLSPAPTQQEGQELSRKNFSLHQEVESDSSTNLDSDTDDHYDPAEFYHTPQPKRPPPTEKVLTFCTKEIAIRDRHNLVIACGSETEIWVPYRCPSGSECFLSTDSSYRICCAVADSVRYA
ncbi:unnamed protein product [Gongylonema pulchrum]|uniref:Uncharacterized protein n=1 Tax=Gongylonema pulchrum TaxID=637853 RepID=A0A3P6Q2S2_9BILA|nr:unnamed protein product [Gongylonema pulchrum]